MIEENWLFQYLKSRYRPDQWLHIVLLYRIIPKTDQKMLIGKRIDGMNTIEHCVPPT